MCQECGCSVVREVAIDGQPSRSQTSPLLNASFPGEHNHPGFDGEEHAHCPEGVPAHGHQPGHAPPHGHEHPHEHEHQGEHNHPHSHEHDHPHRTLPVHEAILAQNDRLAERNRGFFKAKNLLVLNVLSSPGSGKTTFIQKTISLLSSRLRTGVIVGDLETENDAQRLRSTGAPVVQITTGTVCHLEAEMVARAMSKLNLDALDLLIIENVGNLVCPAAYDLGEDVRVVLLSVTEGEDKPLKYPPVFHSAHVAVVSKIDLSVATEFNRDAALSNLRRLSPKASIFEVSARTGQGMDAWINYLLQQRQQH